MILLILFLALWDGPGKATVSWNSTERTCLYYQGTFVECRPPGKYTLTFGHEGSLDAAYRPQLGAIYTLVGDSGAVWRAEVKKRAVYLPVFRA